MLLYRLTYVHHVGKQVDYVEVPHEGVKASLLGFGWPEWQVDGIIELNKLANEGHGVWKSDIQAVLGRPAVTIKQWIQGVAPAFK